MIAALPMYDWPQERAATDALWARMRDALRAAGIEAPDALARRNGDLPPVPGGIRDEDGAVIAPDPATLPPDGFDLPTMWRHPDLLFGQTCWGPMGEGLAAHVQVFGQPDYSRFEGGQGPLYSSALVMRGPGPHVPPDDEGRGVIHPERLEGLRFAFNDLESISGYHGIRADLAARGASPALFCEHVETGAHIASVRAVAQGRADVAAIDCRSWALAQRFEPAAAALRVVGWTARRPGLPFIGSGSLPPQVAAGVMDALRTLDGVVTDSG